MTHYLQALLIPTSGGQRLIASAAPAHPVQIGGRLLLVPLTDELLDFLVAGDSSSTEYDDIFWKYHPAIHAFGSAAAGAEPFGYIETDYFGGQGAQAAGAWRGSEVLVAPRKAATGPVNDVLRALGVLEKSGVDEFETVGLSRHRHMEDWLGEPRFPSRAESRMPVQARTARRITFDRPDPAFPRGMRDAIAQVIAQISGIEEAYLAKCSIQGELPENVLIVAIDDRLPIEDVLGQLLPRLRLLLGAGQHLDVVPFPLRALPPQARIVEGIVSRARKPVRPWWKFW